MVDAHAAVKSALVNTDTENINVDLQTYVKGTQPGWQTGSGTNTITGHSWSRSGSVDRIEYSVDGSSWKSVKYAPGTNESIYIDWEISLSTGDFSFTGDHVVLVRSVDADGMHSISAHSEFYAYGESSESSSTQNMALLVAVGVLLLVGIAVIAYRKNFLN